MFLEGMLVRALDQHLRLPAAIGEAARQDFFESRIEGADSGATFQV